MLRDETRRLLEELRAESKLLQELLENDRDHTGSLRRLRQVVSAIEASTKVKRRCIRILG